MKLFLLFLLFTTINVVLSTVKSIVTVNSGKTVAALINGFSYAFYNVVLIYTVMEFPLWQKCLVTFVTNVVGVFLVKWIEEKTRKAKLWKIEFSIEAALEDEIKDILKNLDEDIEFYYVPVGRNIIFNVFVDDKVESRAVKTALKQYHPKYFVSEAKCFD